jgi:hypothetical protein
MPTTHITTTGTVRYSAAYRDTEGQQHLKTFDTIEEAQHLEDAMARERTAHLESRRCAREGCDEPVVQNVVDGRLVGREKRYHSEACERRAAQDRKNALARTARSTRPPKSPPPPIECPQCHELVPQTGLGRPRKFCPGKSCADDFWNAQKERKHGDQAGYDAVRHMLTDLNPDTMTATCSLCGPNTRVWRAGSTGRVQCSSRARAQHQKPHSQRSNRESAWRRRGIDLTEEQYDALFDAQGGCCAVCERELERRSKDTHVDHDHETKLVRGILCHGCNNGIGQLGENLEIVRRAADYLERNATTAVRP